MDALGADDLKLHPFLQRHPSSTVLFKYELEQVINKDLKFVALSITVVLIYMWVHMRSLFLSVSAMLIILVSFPVAQFIYRGIFRITLFTQLNMIVIFIVIGMEAANIFIFYDAWR